MNYNYLEKNNKLQNIKILDKTLLKLDDKDKLNKYNCLEIGSENCTISIPISSFFNNYYAIEPNKKNSKYFINLGSAILNALHDFFQKVFLWRKFLVGLKKHFIWIFQCKRPEK